MTVIQPCRLECLYALIVDGLWSGVEWNVFGFGMGKGFIASACSSGPSQVNCRHLLLAALSRTQTGERVRQTYG